MGSSTSKQLNAVDVMLSVKRYSRKQKDALIVYGYIHQQIINNTIPNFIFPAALIDLCLLFYHIKCEILKWSKVWKTPLLQLTHDDTCIGSQSSGDNQKKLRGYKYALCDTLPIKTGIVCWRFQIKNPNRYWYSTSIAKPNTEYPNDGTSKHGVWGVGTDPNWYPYNKSSAGRWREGHNNHSGNWGYPNKEITSNGVYHIDMLFDADKGEIQFCVLEDKTRYAKIWGIPIDKENGDGYVPHFNTISIKDCEIRIANIHIESYGQHIDDIFISDDIH